MDYVIVNPDGTWNSSLHLDHTKRYRATVVIFDSDKKILLVKDRGRNDYSLPGGGFKHNESTIAAGTREVYEELGIKALSAIRLYQCDFTGHRASHKVCQIIPDIKHQPYLKSKELVDFIWWDRICNIPVQGHVNYILSKLF